MSRSAAHANPNAHRPTTAATSPAAPHVPRVRYRTPRAAPQPKHASDEYTEVRQAFKRILTSKASVSNQMEPWKMELGKQLSRNRVAKEDQHMKMEHAREIQHLHRRINQSHSLAERKKNKNDATLYPALLLRKSSSTPPGELWRQAAAAKSASPRGTVRKFALVYSMAVPPARPPR